MLKTKYKLKKTSDLAVVPEYKTSGSSGMDLSSVEEVTLQPFERRLVSTGLAIQLERGYEAQVRPRSSTSSKHGITLINCVGTIDEDFRGTIFVPLINLSNEPYTVKVGDRIAQMVIAQYVRAEAILVDELDETERGEGGFGSTGR